MHNRMIRKIVCLYMTTALAWWCVFYPELCFNSATCRQIIVQNGKEQAVAIEDLRGLLMADSESIEFSSKLLEWICETRK